MNLEFGKNLKKLRRENDLTQDELAQKLCLSTQAISRYETGAAYPDIEMLPVIAGFFGTTIDKLLGVSRDSIEKRKDWYYYELRKITDRKKRLELLRREHAEFPDDWDIVNAMMYEMIYIPECLDEMRKTISEAMNKCTDMLWRENMIFFYLRAEPDEKIAYEFIEKWSSRYNMMKIELLENFYSSRNESEKLKRVKQAILQKELNNSLFRLTGRYGEDYEKEIKDCNTILNFLIELSENPTIEKPDMWVNTKLQCMLRLANNHFMLSSAEETDRGFEVLEKAVALFENFFSLENGTVLTYGSKRFDELSAKTSKEVYLNITEFSGVIATSMMMDLHYLSPIGPVDENSQHVYDMEGFKRTMVFSSHFASPLIFSSWDGLSRVNRDPRYNEIVERVIKVSSIESIDNMLYYLNMHKNRTDDWAKDKKWTTMLVVKNIGAYPVWDDEENIKEIFERMKNEGNTSVYRTFTVEIGGDIIPLPDIIKKKLIELNPDNRNAEFAEKNSLGELVFTKISNK